MDLQKEKQKIKKALRVIELIETCNNERKQHLHYSYKFITLKDYYLKRAVIMQGVKARLENYYKNLIK